MTQSQHASSPSSRAVWWAAGFIVVVMTLNWVAAVARFQVNGVYWDQWIYLKPLFEGGGWFDLFTQQHGPHRQGVAFVVTAWIMDLTAWDSRVEALWIVSLLTMAAVLVLIWKYRLTGRLNWADLWLPLAALAMRQYENVILVPNASHSMFPLVLMMAGALVMLRPLTLRRWIGLGVIGFAAIFTGFGLFVWGALAAVTCLVAVKRFRQKRWSALAAPGLGGALLGGALLFFLRGYVFNPASPGATFPHFPLGDYPMFVVRMLASRMGMLDGSSVAVWTGGIVLVLGVAVWAHASWRIVSDDECAPADLAAVYFLTLGFGYAFFTALGRVHLGVEGGEASRYTPLMISIWLGLLAWVSGRPHWIRNGCMALLGWGMVLVPWMDIWDRPWRDLPGTLGMSERSRTAIVWTSSYKTKWLLAWEDSGDWREAERRVPLGTHPDPGHAPLAQQIEFLRDRDLSFHRASSSRYDWLPWWNPLGVSWVQGMGGEHQQWMGEEARFLIDGADAKFVNLRVAWRVSTLPDDAPIAVRLGAYRGETTYEELRGGISIPAPADREQLTLQSLAGVGAIHPPHDMRPGSFLVLDPTVTSLARHRIRWWSETEPETGLLADEVRFDLERGFYNWEENGAFIWTGPAAVFAVRSRQTRYLNIEVAGRYSSVDEGPVLVELNGRETRWDLPTEGGRFSIEVPGGQSHRITLRNEAGARSPAAEGESDDDRQLALRLSRIDLAETPAFGLIVFADPGEEE